MRGGYGTYDFSCLRGSLESSNTRIITAPATPELNPARLPAGESAEGNRIPAMGPVLQARKNVPTTQAQAKRYAGRERIRPMPYIRIETSGKKTRYAPRMPAAAPDEVSAGGPPSFAQRRWAAPAQRPQTR